MWISFIKYHNNVIIWTRLDIPIGSLIFHFIGISSSLREIVPTNIDRTVHGNDNKTYEFCTSLLAGARDEWQAYCGEKTNEKKITKAATEGCDFGCDHNQRLLKTVLRAALPWWITNESREKKSIQQFTAIPSTEADHYHGLGWVDCRRRNKKIIKTDMAVV